MRVNRRQFFKGLAIAGAGVALWEPTKTIFLPPAGGWKPYMLPEGYMREVEQYYINFDELRWRYDAVGRNLLGEEYSFHVDMYEQRPEIAREIIAKQFQEDGLRVIKPGTGRQFKLVLPRTAHQAGYV